MTDPRTALEEAFEKAFKVIHTEPDDESGNWWPWSTKRDRFHRFLDAEAWTDAAMMLVPEGWRTAIRSFEDGTAAAIMWHPLEVQPTWAERKPTLELALLAACIEAKEQADG